MATRFSLFSSSTERLKAAALAVVMALLICLPAPPADAADVLFKHTDPKGDDKGPGRYTYPKNDVFENGTFDMRTFEVLDLGNKVEFRITIDGNIVREHGSWREARGWVLQLMDIYIDEDRVTGSGETDALPGRGVVFEPASAWEQVVVVSPRSRERVVRAVQEYAEKIDFMLIGERLVVPAYPKVTKRTFIARVPKAELGDPQPWWGYQVLMMAHNDSDASYTFMNKEVGLFSREMEFGGGTNFRGDPNVIDLLDGPGQFDQYAALSRYESRPDPRYNKFAVIKCVYYGEKPGRPEPAPAKPPVSPVPVALPVQPDIPAPSPVHEQPAAETPAEAPGTVVEELLDEGQFPVELMENTPEGECRRSMARIHRAAVVYFKHHPEDDNITLLDLIYEGYLKEKPNCPSGGRYVIYGEDSGRILVRCINPTGVEHGIFPNTEGN